jgi:hypothetical protein
LLLFLLCFFLTKQCHLMEIIFVYLTQMIEVFKCAANHKTVKMKSRSSYTCQTDMYTLQYLYRPNIVHLWLAVFEELTMMKMWHKSLGREMISRQIWIHKHSLQSFFGLCVVKKADIQYWFAKQKHHFSHKQTIKFCQEKYVNY